MGKMHLIAAESGTGMMAAIRINNNCTAEGNLELKLTSWWEKDLDAGIQYIIMQSRTGFSFTRKEENKPETRFSMNVILFCLISQVLADLWIDISRHWKSGWLSLAWSVWPTCHAPNYCCQEIVFHHLLTNFCVMHQRLYFSKIVFSKVMKQNIPEKHRHRYLNAHYMLMLTFV